MLKGQDLWYVLLKISVLPPVSFIHLQQYIWRIEYRFVLLLNFMFTQFSQFDFQNTVVRPESEWFKDVFSLSSVQRFAKFFKDIFSSDLWSMNYVLNLSHISEWRLCLKDLQVSIDQLCMNVFKSFQMNQADLNVRWICKQEERIL